MWMDKGRKFSVRSVFFLTVLFGISTLNLSAQYDIDAMNYGVMLTKNAGNAEEIGVGIRAEYAFNCSTTFLAEFNHSFALGDDKSFTSYNDWGIGVNVILFNWYPTTITAGMGYTGNDSKDFENVEDEAFLSIVAGSINHGAQVKIRALHQLSEAVHIFAEANVKSLGNRYHTFGIGISYDFYKG